MQHGRLPWPTRDQLDERQAALYDSITGGPRNVTRAFPMADEEGRLHGPFNAMVLEPVVGSVVSDLGVALRYQSVLPKRMREIGILEVAATLKSEFEWFAHAAIARTLEVTEEDLDAIRLGRPALGLSEDEALARNVAHALVTRHDLDDNEYEAAAKSLDLPVLADLVFLVGFYTTIATTLAAFRVPLPDGMGRAFAD